MTAKREHFSMTYEEIIRDAMSETLFGPGQIYRLLTEREKDTVDIRLSKTRARVNPDYSRATGGR